MKRYKLKKDTPAFKAGTECYIEEAGNMVPCRGISYTIVHKDQLEKNPDHWFVQWQMSRPEEERTGFAPNDGKCYYCGKAICEGENAITVGSLGDCIITGCPYCHKSYCD